MISTLAKTTLIFTAIILSACAPGGRQGGAGPNLTVGGQSDPGPSSGGGTAEVSTKLALKSAGTKRALIGTSRDLREFLKNSENAEFLVIEGQQRVRWASSQDPVMKFVELGAVIVRVSDPTDGASVDLKLSIQFDHPVEEGGGVGLPPEPIDLPPPIQL